ncbi:MAG: peptidoglycan DD-metalloendopeptidase family protein [Clostridia bacterium]|nr:peptidoglycan DD-metalloendopeptidase family protein [Clostridia bacterium]
MNIKKLFPERKISKKGLVEFLDKKGFYIVLILCIAIVGSTAVFVTTHNITSSNTEFDNKIIPEEPDKASTVDDKKVAQSAINTTPAAPVQKAQQKGPEANKPATPSNAAKQPAEQNSKSSTPGAKSSTSPAATQTKSQKFIMPVFGPVTFEYAQNKLLFSKTLEEWRTHSGLDIGGEKGSPVKAVADGVVSEIKNDPRLGVVVIIDHKDGLKTVYANLASDEMVNPNQKVKQGDIIGAVGTTASFESAEQPHLHFEVLKNNEPVSPAEYLPKK